jgi:hypothetical protein
MQSNNIERPMDNAEPENIGEWDREREPGRGHYPMNDPDAGQPAMGVPGAHGQKQKDPFHTAKGDEVTEQFGHPHTSRDHATQGESENSPMEDNPSQKAA